MKTTITTAAMRKNGPAALGSEFCCALRDRAFTQKLEDRNEASDLTYRLAADIQVLLERYNREMANLNLQGK